MNDDFMPAEFTDAQWRAYIAAAEQQIARRRINGALLSTFDFLAGASLVFFVTGNNNRMPFKWILGMVDDSGLPTGLLEEANEVKSKLEEARQILYSLESMIEKFYTMEGELKVFQKTMREQFVELDTRLEGALDLARKTRVSPTDPESEGA